MTSAGYGVEYAGPRQTPLASAAVLGGVAARLSRARSEYRRDQKCRGQRPGMRPRQSGVPQPRAQHFPPKVDLHLSHAPARESGSLDPTCPFDRGYYLRYYPFQCPRNVDPSVLEIIATHNSKNDLQSPLLSGASYCEYRRLPTRDITNGGTRWQLSGYYLSDFSTEGWCEPLARIEKGLFEM